MRNNDVLPRSFPENEGVSPAAIIHFLDKAEQNGLELHAFMMLRHGRVIAEGAWHPYNLTRPHAVYSVTKSVTALAVGMAVDDGLLSIDDRLIDYFPEEMTPGIRENMKDLQIRHLLTMSTGHISDTCRFGEIYQFMADRPAIRLGDEPDVRWTGGFFRQPIVREPGTWFAYNSGASHMLAEIIRKITGKTLAGYLQPRLFDPLGIPEPIWDESPDGASIGGYGLSLTIEDLARIGQLCLQRGKWRGRQLVSGEWLDQASACQISTADSGLSIPDYLNGYGYHLWRSQSGGYRMDGAFGQYCLVQPDHDTVIAIFGSLVGRETQDILDLVWQVMLPGIKTDPCCPGSLREDAGGSEKLNQKLASLSLPAAKTLQSGAFQGTMLCKLDPNDDGVRTVRMTWAGMDFNLSWEDGSGHHELQGSLNAWKTALHPVTGDLTATFVRFLDDDVFALESCRLLTPYHDRLLCRLSGEKIEMTYLHRGFAMKDRTLSGTVTVTREQVPC